MYAGNTSERMSQKLAGKLQSVWDHRVRPSAGAHRLPSRCITGSASRLFPWAWSPPQPFSTAHLPSKHSRSFCSSLPWAGKCFDSTSIQVMLITLKLHSRYSDSLLSAFYPLSSPRNSKPLSPVKPKLTFLWIFITIFNRTLMHKIYGSAK